MLAMLIPIFAVALLSGAAQAQTPAFPGAEGYGRLATGGRNGVVLMVTRLDDAMDPTGRPAQGTLRACVAATALRTCVFKIGGRFVLSQGPLMVTNSFLTIAGQTAPGGGVLVTHDGGASSGSPVVIKGATDVVIRHLRSRPIKSPRPTLNDGFTIDNARRVMLDHVSASWAEDENLNTHRGATDITVSWSVFAEGLIPHSKCALINSNPTDTQRISFANNICASNNDRNPDLQSLPSACIDIINNLFYNPNSEFTEIWSQYGGSWANIVGNVYQRGPNTNKGVYAILWQTVGSTGLPRLYVQDNIASGSLIPIVEPELLPHLSASPVCPLSLPPAPSTTTYAAVVAHAGAFPRDAVDKRILAEIASGGGSLKRDPGEMPGIEGGKAYVDVDQDGMADSWERQNGLNPASFDAWSRPDAQGFLALDRFLDYAHRQRLSGAKIP